MKIHISFYVNYCKVLAFCFVKEVHNVLRLLQKRNQIHSVLNVSSL